MAPLDNMPLLMFFVIVVLISLLCFEAGFLQGRRIQNKSNEQSEAPVGAMVAGVLALLAFMLTFTFGIALDRFDERRLLVVEEANAIGTTYLRADFLDGPAKAKVQALLREYVSARLSCLEHPEHVQQAINRAEAVQQGLWKQAVEIGRAQPTPISGLFVSALNDVIDLHSKRVIAGLHTRVPVPVWVGLLCISALSMAGIGCYCGRSGTRARAESLILIATFSTVLLLVADLDRPSQGYFRVDQQPIIDLARQIGAK